MTWQQWLVVAFLAVSMFGLGCIFARAVLIRRGGAIATEKANAVLAIFFTVIALAVGVDAVYTQISFRRFARAQVDCNTKLLDTEVIISKQRQSVDNAAIDYDTAMTEYLRVASTKPVVPNDDMAYLQVQDKLAALERTRLAMIQTYAQHPWPPSC